MSMFCYQCEQTSKGARRTMPNHNSKQQIITLAIDLSKQSFQLHGVDAQGQCVLRKKLTRAKLLVFIASKKHFEA